TANGAAVTDNARGRNFRRTVIVALQHIAMVGARQPFDRLVSGQDARATEGQRRLVEGANAHVDGHACAKMLEACPVEAAHSLVAITLASVAHHDVVATLAVHAVAKAV